MKTFQVMLFLNTCGCAVVNNPILPMTCMISTSAIYVAINKQKNHFNIIDYRYIHVQTLVKLYLSIVRVLKIYLHFIK